MGICISCASKEIHVGEDVQENAVFFRENFVTGDHDNAQGVKYGWVCSQQGSKGLNQDAAILYQGYGKEDGDLCGVFDGHGLDGDMVSKIVRNRLPSLILNQMNVYTSFKDFSKWQQACITAFKLMQNEIKLQKNFDCSSSGTTAAIVIRQGQQLIIANLGDSRAVLGTTFENGELKPLQLTTDFKPGLPDEAERIRKCNGRVMAIKEEEHIQRVWLPHENSPGLAMSRSFGDLLLKNHGVIALPEVSHHPITNKDQFVIVATDGVWDVLSNNEAVSIVSGAHDEKMAATSLVQAATAAWNNKFPSSKIDDISVVCLFLNKTHKLTL